MSLRETSEELEDSEEGVKSVSENVCGDECTLERRGIIRTQNLVNNIISSTYDVSANLYEMLCFSPAQSASVTRESYA